MSELVLVIGSLFNDKTASLLGIPNELWKHGGKETSRIESGGGMMFCLAAGAFVDDTIWVENCQVSIQYALDIVSKFFVINDISINSEKTVAILINQGVRVASLNICGQPISIAKEGKAHYYLEIFLFIEGLSKSSIAKAHSDVCIFINVLLKKAVVNKQFLYLVLAVLQSIVGYWTQFSYVLSNVCHG
ncbi:hypothetical protein G9A89_005147 [Geosiphon pyriformis]|nr:hypothetical protein G9A89_005147 [Geosiphon pyriformis]